MPSTTVDDLTDIALARMVARAEPIVIDVLAEHLAAQSTLRLGDAEQDAVLAAARPLTAAQRDAFFADVLAALRGVAAIGPGALHRILTELQRRHFVPPKSVGEDAEKRRARGVARRHSTVADSI